MRISQIDRLQIWSQLLDNTNRINRNDTKNPITNIYAGQKTYFDILLDFNASQQTKSTESTVYAYDYNRLWLSYPNSQLTDLAESIVKKSDTNDEKANKIINWVLDNFPYKTDQENYGTEEFWAPPLLALAKDSGDCEDGAFLVHSLLLHAGVPYERIKTYGGLVNAGDGAETGGHAWTLYQRETDNQWIVLDTSYYPNRLNVSDRKPYESEKNYVDEFFNFNLLYWTTKNQNTFAYNSTGSKVTELNTGNLINIVG